VSADCAAAALGVDNRTSADGRRVRVRRPNISCAGDGPNCSEAVFRQSSSAIRRLPCDSLAFSIKGFAVLTAEVGEIFPQNPAIEVGLLCSQPRDTYLILQEFLVYISINLYLFYVVNHSNKA